MELSLDILNKIHELDNEKLNCFLQIFEFTTEKVKPKVWLSDGIYKLNFFMLDSISLSIQEVCQPGDIINCIILYSSKLGSCVMMKFQKSNTEPLDIIGEPMAIEKPGEIPEVKLQPTILLNNQISSIQISSNQDPMSFNQISQLNQYERDFRIRGRVLSKSPLIEYKNQKGERCFMFNILIKDSSATLQVSFFNDQASNFYSQINEQEIYSFETGRISLAKPNNKFGCKFEFFVTAKTLIEKLSENSELPKFHFNLRTTSQLKNLQENCSIDILALVEKVNVPERLTLKSGESKMKRQITIRDEDFKIDLIAWGEMAEALNIAEGQILLFQNLQFKDYKGLKQLTFQKESKVLHSLPDLPKCKEILQLKLIGPSEVPSLSQVSYTKTVTYSSIQEILTESKELLRHEGTQEQFNLIAQLTQIPDKLFYKACIEPNCKKGVQYQNGAYYCSKCNKSAATFLS